LKVKTLNEITQNHFTLSPILLALHICTNYTISYLLFENDSVVKEEQLYYPIAIRQL